MFLKVLDLPEILAEVLKVYPNIKLEIIGDYKDDIKEKIEQEFRKLGFFNNVDILGYMENKKDAFKKILSSKAVIFPSYEEGWGLALFEAILLKMPVVVYRLPIFDELFGEDILSADKGNKKEFAKKIIFCIDPKNNEEVLKSVEKCYEKAKKYDWENVFNNERQRIQLLL
jgi:glycosyltransferase involved in cell wall biosynthesis